jgi:predicted transcriptional regulator
MARVPAVVARARVQRALELRALGLSQAAIARELRITESGVSVMLKRFRYRAGTVPEPAAAGPDGGGVKDAC